MKNSFSKADERIKNYKEGTSDTKQDTETIELCNYIITYKKEDSKEGGCGSVHRVITYTPKGSARRKLRNVCLKKAITKQYNELILTEIEIYDRINERIRNNKMSLNIPDPDCFDYTPNDSEYPAYIMEYLKKGTTLAKWFLTNKNVTKKELVEKLYEVFITLYHLHHLDGEQGYIHCDIKPDNIVFQEIGQGTNTRKCLKLIDFGLCHGPKHDTIKELNHKICGEKETTDRLTILLNYPFFPPETEKCNFYELSLNKGVGPEFDVYSMCCTIYYLTAFKNLKSKSKSENFASFETKTYTKLISKYTKSKQSFIEQIKFYWQIRKDTKLNHRETRGLLRGLSWKPGRQLVEMWVPQDTSDEQINRITIKEKDTLWYYFKPKGKNKITKNKSNKPVWLIFVAIVACIFFAMKDFIFKNSSFVSYPEGSILNMEWKDQELYDDFKEYYENNKEKTSLLENDCRNDVKSIFINNGTIMLSDDGGEIGSEREDVTLSALTTEPLLYYTEFTDMNSRDKNDAYDRSKEADTKKTYTTFEDLNVFFPQLETLIIYNCDFSKEEAKKSISQLKNLKNLELRGCNIGNLDFISETEKLFSLAIECSGESKYMDGIPPSSTLTNLEIKNYKEINLDNLSELTNLSSLHIDGGYESVKLKEELLSFNKNQLKGLHLLGANKDILPIIDYYSDNITSLSIGYSDFSDCTQELVNCIYNCDKLTALNINGSSFSSLMPFVDYFEPTNPNISKVTTIWAQDLKDNNNTPFTLKDYIPFFKYKGNVHIDANLFSMKENDYAFYDNIRKSTYETLIIDGYDLFFSKESSSGSYFSVDKYKETGDLSKSEMKVNIDYLSDNTEIVSKWSTRENPCLGLTELAYFFPYTKNLIIYNSNLNIDSECGIQCFSNLETLYISNCNYVDCSVFDCDNLHSITDIRLQNIDDIRKGSKLTALVNLRTLRLGNANVKLSELKGLNYLNNFVLNNYPYEMQKSDYDFIKGNTNVEQVMLVWVALDNELLIDSLSDKDKMIYLFLINCNLNSLSCFENLSQLKSLKKLRITGNDISDWSPLDWCENVEGRPMDDS